MSTPIAFVNMVTEKQRLPAPLTFWIVEAEWRGGHDNRVIRLFNIYLNESDAVKCWESLTPERHNKVHKFPPDTDRGYRRYPIRIMKETK